MAATARTSKAPVPTTLQGAQSCDRPGGCCCGGRARVVEACPAALTGASLLTQAAGFIEVINDRVYARESKVMAGGTIGKHFRHALDHFAAALGGAKTGNPIEYDRRERNVPMETDRGAALAAIRALVGELAGTAAPMSGAAVRVRVMLSADGSEAEFASTLGRELAFAAHHAVHHHAMIRAIAEEHGVSVPAGFGMAPSTAKFQSQLGEPAGR